jgi:hypothetical protein
MQIVFLFNHRVSIASNKKQLATTTLRIDRRDSG